MSEYPDWGEMKDALAEHDLAYVLSAYEWTEKFVAGLRGDRVGMPRVPTTEEVRRRLEAGEEEWFLAMYADLERWLFPDFLAQASDGTRPSPG